MTIYQLIWLIPALPLAAFLVLAIFGGSRRVAALIGTVPVGLSAVVTIWTAVTFITAPPPENAFSRVLWQWFSVGKFSPGISLYLDPLSVVFIFVITFVGFLILLYSTEFMKDEEGYSRFFAYMNLFIFSMLVLVLAKDLLLLYLGWEGVGLSSFLLIGFWYKDPADAGRNAYAARKAFLVTRIGDTALILGLFLLLQDFGSLDIPYILHAAPGAWTPGSSRAVWATILLLGGAVGKSAQLPLQTWLPDAMAGPSPVSALIHAATMVTAGVYLIARTHVLFSLAPVVQLIVAIVGAATLVIAAFSALAQRDIKRVLAYSTMSQIGYMFLALGVGAWSAAVFHFMIHAFFKALLFLGAGAVILAMDHEHDMFKMGGLRKQMPVVFWTFLAGSAALAALPLVTAGFFSKDPILFFAAASTAGSTWLWLAGFVAALVTSLYTFRMVFVTFFGVQRKQVHYRPGLPITIPLVVLGVLSVVAGWIQLPPSLGHFTPFSDFMARTLPAAPLKAVPGALESGLEIATAVIALVGLYLAWQFYIRTPMVVYRFKQTAFGGWLYRFLQSGCGFDALYGLLVVTPVVWLSRIDRRDFIDLIYEGIGTLNLAVGRLFGLSANGRVRGYVFAIALGAVILVTLTLLL
jgi:NADH-quinone oxidoreductase subunit L